MSEKAWQSVENHDQSIESINQCTCCNVYAVGNMHIRRGKLNGSTSFAIYNMHYVNFRIQV